MQGMRAASSGVFPSQHLWSKAADPTHEPSFWDGFCCPLLSSALLPLLHPPFSTMVTTAVKWGVRMSGF